MKSNNIFTYAKVKCKKKAILELIRIFKIKSKVGSKINYKKINLSNIDWAFVLKSNKSHFKLIE